MKTRIALVVFAALVVATGITYSFVRDAHTGAEMRPPVDAGPSVSSKIIHVDELAKSPGGFKGEIVLRGVVAGVRKPEGVFGVIDAREVESCGVLTCAKNLLPIKFEGEAPELKAIVQITGHVVRDKKGLIIEAKHVELVP